MLKSVPHPHHPGLDHHYHQHPVLDRLFQMSQGEGRGWQNYHVTFFEFLTHILKGLGRQGNGERRGLRNSANKFHMSKGRRQK